MSESGIRNPYGVPLGEINDLLEKTPFESKLVKNGMEVSSESLTAVLSVIDPPVKEAPVKDIKAIVTIKTYLPEEFAKFMANPEFRIRLNKMATFASLIQDETGVYLGSRLTTYEDETGWPVYQPMLLYALATTNGVFKESLETLGGRKNKYNETSEWTDEDFELAKSYLDQMSVCSTGGLSLTAEFGIEAEDISAIMGHQTALWRMFAKQPHPALGGGLFCILELPFGFEQPKLLKVIDTLNSTEMLPHDLPPHFGSWTKGNRFDNPAYVSFLPNPLHSQAKNIHVNMSMWAYQRVQFACSTLMSHGFLNGSSN